MELEALYDPDKDPSKDPSKHPSKNPDLKPPQPVKLTVKEMAASMVSRLVLGFILFLSFLIGGWVAGTALHDPDTCWLLGLGRVICESGIPATDPFSWTFAAQEADGRHFVLYQWLSEALFYVSMIPGGLLTLLMLTAVVIVTAFLSLPLGIVVRRNPPFLVGLLVVVLGILAASFHTLTRPEIFSFMFLALFLQVLHYARMTVLCGGDKLFRYAFVLAPLMVLWCNMHTGFISGFTVLGATVAGSLLGLVFKSPRRDLLFQSIMAFVACIIASLATPYAFKLWLYIPDLFGSPINKYIQELKPITLNTLSNPIYWPYALLSSGFVLLWLREVLQPVPVADTSVPVPVPPGQNAASVSGPVQLPVGALLPEKNEKIEGWPAIRKTELTIALLMGAIAIWSGFSHRRLITFSALILVGEICALLGLRRLRGLKVECDPAVLSVTGLKSEMLLPDPSSSSSSNPSPNPDTDFGQHNAKPSASGVPASTELSNTVTVNSGQDLAGDKPDGTEAVAAAEAKIPFWQYLDLHSLDLWKSGGAFELAIVSFFAIAGVSLVANRIAKPELPASSVAFHNPVQAVKYIEDNEGRLGSRLFNDAQFGDVLIWQLKGNPKVFLDTRFDMYGPKLAGDYQTILECFEGWQKLLESYRIDWVFVRSDSALAKALLADKNWQKLYLDNVSVILKRVPAVAD